MVTEASEDVRIRVLTLLMTAVSTCVIELAIGEPERSKLGSVLWALALMLPVIVGVWYRARSACQTTNGGEVEPRERGASRGGVSGSAVLVVLSAFVLPFLIDAGRVVWFGRGAMLEILLLVAVRNLGLVLAALSDRVIFARLAALVSLFMVAVCSAMAEGTLTIVVVGIYASLGCLWLMLSYWTRLRLSAEAGAGAKLPFVSMGFVVAFLGLTLALAVVGPTRAATILAGLMPTSGGTFWDDPEARSGVNDGDNEVAATEKPESVGFTESDIYLESERPSLYDAFTETYGEPFKKKKNERMIALAQKDIQEQKESPAENLRAGRQFPLSRKKPTQAAARPKDRLAKALIYVKGRTPLHLPLIAYDQFDGESWTEARRRIARCQLETEKGSAWFRLDAPYGSFFAGIDSHQIKIGLLESSPLPIPAHLARFRIGQVDRLDFFDWSQDGILKMVDRTVPASTLIETENHTIDYRRLKDASITIRAAQIKNNRYLGNQNDYTVDPAVATLAKSWTDGIPEGWGQVEAIVEALRRNYTLDRAATQPPDCRDAVAHFLMTSRRGPDYQFATAAAVMLQSLGYPSRVVSGFYASPEKYDARTHHTHVDREDVHFWAEVLATGSWVAIEPTPGYRLADPVIPWTERLAAQMLLAWHWVMRHPSEILAFTAIGLLAFRYRRHVFDLASTLAWRSRLRESPRRRILRTLRLVEHRARWAGRPRPIGQTPQKWFRAVSGSEASEIRDEFKEFLRLADWAGYAPDGLLSSIDPPEESIRSTCRRVVRTWTLGRFQTAALSA